MKNKTNYEKLDDCKLIELVKFLDENNLAFKRYSPYTESGDFVQKVGDNVYDIYYSDNIHSHYITESGFVFANIYKKTVNCNTSISENSDLEALLDHFSDEIDEFKIAVNEEQKENYKNSIEEAFKRDYPHGYLIIFRHNSLWTTSIDYSDIYDEYVSTDGNSIDYNEEGNYDRYLREQIKEKSPNNGTIIYQGCPKELDWQDFDVECLLKFHEKKELCNFRHQPDYEQLKNALCLVSVLEDFDIFAEDPTELEDLKAYADEFELAQAFFDKHPGSFLSDKKLAKLKDFFEIHKES